MKKLNQRLLLIMAITILPFVAKAQLIPTQNSAWTKGILIRKHDMNAFPKRHFLVGDVISVKGDLEARKISGTLISSSNTSIQLKLENESITISYEDIKKIQGMWRWGLRSRYFRTSKWVFQPGEILTQCGS